MHRAIPPDLSTARWPQPEGVGQHGAIGDLHLAADNFSGAVESFSAALREVAPEAVAERCSLLQRLADAEAGRGGYEAAERALREAREASRLLGDPRVRAGIAMRLAFVSNERGRPRSCRRYALYAYSVLRDTDDHRTVGNAELLVGLACMRLGRMHEAIEWLQSSAATFRRIDHVEGLVSALNNLGLVYKNLREWREATRFLEQALQLDERAGLYARMRVHNQNLGLVRYRLGQWDLAEENFRQSLRIARETGHAQGEALALLAFGMLARRRRHFERADEHFRRALTLANSVDAKRESLLAREFLGELDVDRGNPGGALALLVPALEEARQSAPRGDVAAELETRLGLARLALGELDEAESHLARGMALAGQLGDRLEVAIAERGMARLSAARGDAAGLEARIRTAAAHFDELNEAWESATTLAAWGEAVLSLPASVRLRVALEPVADAARRAAAQFRGLGVVPAAAEAIITLARLEAERERYDQALALLEQAEEWLAGAGDASAEDRAETLRRDLERQYVAVSLATCNELRALDEVNRVFRETADTDAMLAQTVRLAVETAGGDRGFVAYSAGSRLDVVAQHGLGRDRARRILRLIEQVAGSRIAESGPVFSSRVAADPRFVTALTEALDGVGSLVWVPLNFPSQSVGLVYVDRLNDNLLGAFKQRELNLLAVLANSAGLAIVEAQRSRLMEENQELRNKLRPSPALDRIVTRSREVENVLALLQKVGDSPATILFMGETGTGKGLLARAVHDVSNRRDRAFVQVNCAALPETLLESELFGHVQGAFTGATRDKVGLFEEAEGGTIFLDEIEKIPESVQAKLLHVLDRSEIRPVGATRSRHVNARVICATGVDLRERIRDGRFLEDLYYRLNDITVRVPPLRERREDIPVLAQHFVAMFSRQMEKSVKGLQPNVMEVFLAHEWRGNVRELEKTIKRMMVLVEDGDPLDLSLLPPELQEAAPVAQAAAPSGKSLRSNVNVLERRMIAESLERNRWNKSRAARELGLSYPTLLSKIRTLHIERRRGS